MKDLLKACEVNGNLAFAPHLVTSSFVGHREFHRTAILTQDLIPEHLTNRVTTASTSTIKRYVKSSLGPERYRKHTAVQSDSIIITAFWAADKRALKYKPNRKQTSFAAALISSHHLPAHLTCIYVCSPPYTTHNRILSQTHHQQTLPTSSHKHQQTLLHHNHKNGCPQHHLQGRVGCRHG